MKFHARFLWALISLRVDGSVSVKIFLRFQIKSGRMVAGPSLERYLGGCVYSYIQVVRPTSFF